MPDFAIRSGQLEIMDDLECSGEVLERTLNEIEFINKWLGGNQITINALDQLSRHFPSREITIVDLGCGGGGMLRIIDQWGKKKNLKLKLVGIDANENVIAFATKNLTDCPHIELISMDIFSEEFRTVRFDVAIGTLFYHHFTGEQLRKFFAQLSKQVEVGYIINDLQRHWLPYYAIKFLTGLFSKSPMVRYDAPLSVLRAFTKKELAHIVLTAQSAEVSIRWKWAFRWQVVAKVAF